MKLKDEFNAFCNVDMIRALRLSHTQQLCTAVGSLLSLRVPPEEIQEVFNDALRMGQVALHAMQPGKTAEENQEAVLAALRNPLRVVE